METKINKEIKEYKENIFFGLSTRQFLCSLLAVIVAAFLYMIIERWNWIKSIKAVEGRIERICCSVFR